MYSNPDQLASRNVVKSRFSTLLLGTWLILLPVNIECNINVSSSHIFGNLWASTESHRNNNQNVSTIADKILWEKMEKSFMKNAFLYALNCRHISTNCGCIYGWRMKMSFSLTRTPTSE